MCATEGHLSVTLSNSSLKETPLLWNKCEGWALYNSGIVNLNCSKTIEQPHKEWITAAHGKLANGQTFIVIAFKNGNVKGFFVKEDYTSTLLAEQLANVNYLALSPNCTKLAISISHLRQIWILQIDWNHTGADQYISSVSQLNVLPTSGSLHFLNNHDLLTIKKSEIQLWNADECILSRNLGGQTSVQVTDFDRTENLIGFVLNCAKVEIFDVGGADFLFPMGSISLENTFQSTDVDLKCDVLSVRFFTAKQLMIATSVGFALVHVPSRTILSAISLLEILDSRSALKSRLIAIQKCNCSRECREFLGDKAFRENDECLITFSVSINAHSDEELLSLPEISTVAKTSPPKKSFLSKTEHRRVIVSKPQAAYGIKLPPSRKMFQPRLNPRKGDKKKNAKPKLTQTIYSNACPEEFVKYSSFDILNSQQGYSVKLTSHCKGKTFALHDSNTIALFNAQLLKKLEEPCQRIIRQCDGICNVCFSLEHEFLLSCEEKRGIRLWNLRSPTCATPEAVDGEKGGFIKGQFYYMDHFILAAYENKLQVLRNDVAPRKIKSLHFKDCRTITDFSAINNFYSHIAAVAFSDKTLRVVDFCTGDVSLRIECLGQTRPFNRIVQNQYSRVDLVASLAPGDGVRLWDFRCDSIRNGRPCQAIRWPQDSSRFGGSRADFSPCGNYLAVTANGTDYVYVYDVRRSGSHVVRLNESRDATDLAFDPINSRLLVAKKGGSIDMYANI